MSPFFIYPRSCCWSEKQGLILPRILINLVEFCVKMGYTRYYSIQWCPLLLGVKGEMDLGLGPGSLYILRSCLLDLWRSYSSKTLPRVPHRPPHEPSHDEHDKKTRTKFTLLRLTVETRHFLIKNQLFYSTQTWVRSRELLPNLGQKQGTFIQVKLGSETGNFCQTWSETGNFYSS